MPVLSIAALTAIFRDLYIFSIVINLEIQDNQGTKLEEKTRHGHLESPSYIYRHSLETACMYVPLYSNVILLNILYLTSSFFELMLE